VQHEQALNRLRRELAIVEQEKLAGLTTAKQSLESELDELRSQNASLQQNVNRLIVAVQRRTKENERLSQSNSDLSRALELLQQQKANSDSSLANLERQVAVLRQTNEQSIQKGEDRSRELTIAFKRLQTEHARLQREARRVADENEMKTSRANATRSAIQGVHSLLAVSPAIDCPVTFLTNLIPKLQQLFNVLSFSPVKATVRTRRLFQFDLSVFGVPPNPDGAKFISPQHARLISSMRQELMSFPIITEAPAIDSNARMTAQLEQLRTLVLLVKRLFQDRESHIEQMGALITSQHLAVMRMSKNTTNREVVEQSQENQRMAQEILAKDRKSRREFGSFMTPKR
jgi:hypothetical protein